MTGRIWRTCAIVAFLSLSIISTAVAGDCPNKGGDWIGPCADDGCGCCSPGTLFQWSYGNSFSGGPDLNAPLVTDRPDFTEASSTVGRGVAQLEIGYTYSYDNDGVNAVKGHSYPEALLRYGIYREWLELRVGWNYGEETTRANRDPVSQFVGAEDLYLGLKIGLTPQEGILPEMAFIPQMFVPTGSAPFSNNAVLPGGNLIYGWEINDLWSTAGSSQFNKRLDPVTGDAYTEFAQSWTVGRSFTDVIGGYAEWYGLFPSGADTVTPEHYFNGGLTFLITDDLQLDVRGGKGLNNAADDYFVGAGMSVRM